MHSKHFALPKISVYFSLIAPKYSVKPTQVYCSGVLSCHTKWHERCSTRDRKAYFAKHKRILTSGLFNVADFFIKNDFILLSFYLLLFVCLFLFVGFIYLFISVFLIFWMKFLIVHTKYRLFRQERLSCNQAFACSLLFVLFGMQCLSMCVRCRDPRRVILCRC